MGGIVWPSHAALGISAGGLDDFVFENNDLNNGGQRFSRFPLSCGWPTGTPCR